MLPLLIASTLDPAGYNMASYMIANHGFKKLDNDLYTNEFAMLYISVEEAFMMKWLDNKFSTLYYVFLSKHRSKSGIPALTCHTTGNFSNSNQMGGNPRELAYVYPSLQKQYMKTLYKKSGRIPNYQLVIEATHHGPTSLTKPILFIEIGSAEQQWHDKNAVSIVCDAVMDTIKTVKEYGSIGIGLGGTHYPSKFTKMLVESDYTFASIAPKYSLLSVDKRIIQQMITKSVENVEYAFMDLKGLGTERDRLISIVNDLGLKVTKV